MSFCHPDVEGKMPPGLTDFIKTRPLELCKHLTLLRRIVRLQNQTTKTSKTSKK
jgi:hypothetical protein